MATRLGDVSLDSRTREALFSLSNTASSLAGHGRYYDAARLCNRGFSLANENSDRRWRERFSAKRQEYLTGAISYIEMRVMALKDEPFKAMHFLYDQEKFARRAGLTEMRAYLKHWSDHFEERGEIRTRVLLRKEKARHQRPVYPDTKEWDPDVAELLIRN